MKASDALQFDKPALHKNIDSQVSLVMSANYILKFISLGMILCDIYVQVINQNNTMLSSAMCRRSSHQI